MFVNNSKLMFSFTDCAPLEKGLMTRLHLEEVKVLVNDDQ